MRRPLSEIEAFLKFLKTPLTPLTSVLLRYSIRNLGHYRVIFNNVDDPVSLAHSQTTVSCPFDLLSTFLTTSVLLPRYGLSGPARRPPPSRPTGACGACQGRGVAVSGTGTLGPGSVATSGVFGTGPPLGTVAGGTTSSAGGTV